MRQLLKSLHFYAPAIFVTLILLDEIDLIFSLSLSTEHSEFTDHLDYTPIDFDEYNIDVLQAAASRDKKSTTFESALIHHLDDFDGGELDGLKKAVIHYYASIECFSFHIVCCPLFI